MQVKTSRAGREGQTDLGQRRQELLPPGLWRVKYLSFLLTSSWGASLPLPCPAARFPLFLSNPCVPTHVLGLPGFSKTPFGPSGDIISDWTLIWSLGFRNKDKIRYILSKRTWKVWEPVLFLQGKFSSASLVSPKWNNFLVFRPIFRPHQLPQKFPSQKTRRKRPE